MNQLKQFEDFNHFYDGNFETYIKTYKYFNLIVSRHWRNNLKDKYDVTLKSNLDINSEVSLIDNVDYQWIENFVKMLEINELNNV